MNNQDHSLDVKDTLPAVPSLPELEEEVLSFWQQDQTFQKSVESKPADKTYVFYDGPPFATGMPHYGHLLASTTKDVIPRYWTMKGYRVDRVWGWDCHGLPIENMIEEQLEIKGGKKGIEELGIDQFNAACRLEVLRLDKQWEQIIARLGRWVDFENNYKTMDNSFMESVWWGFKQLHDKGLTYEGRKVVMYCPRCSTPLSNFEIAMDNSYADVEDFSIFIKFKVVGKENEYLVAWTTTPWTLPGNVALAVKPDAEYALITDESGDQLWFAQDRLEAVLQEGEYSVVRTALGEELVGTAYEPLYPYLEDHRTPKAWTVLPADFVSLDDGTGIVHTAAVFGEDDYALALEHNLPCVPTLDDEGHFLPFVELPAGKFFKQAEKTINQDLESRGLLYKLERITHSYPFCYRCSTPLYYNAVPAWFIDIQQLKPLLLEKNEDINWFPDHLKHGRFGKGLANAPDWNISRSRYWGTPMPVWVAQTTDPQTGQTITHRRVIGSLEELREWAVNPQQVAELIDLHREFLDQVEVWVDDDRTLKGKRISEVFDCWVESGSMPFASRHYPFKNKDEFENNSPAQFVSEYIAQTRAWFYTMHVLSVGIFNQPPFENVLTTGTILAEDGNKMSKSKKNYPDPMLLINEYGSDSLRLYLMSSSVMKAENLNFSQKEVSDIRKKVFLIWWNMYAFYHLYAKGLDLDLTITEEPTDVMDKWALSRLHTVISQVTIHMDQYNVVKASRTLMDYINELSTWYLRRSRDRLRQTENPESLRVFGHILLKTSQLFAPFTPFFSDWLYQQLAKGSVHLSDWPISDQQLVDPQLEQSMEAIRKVVERAHALRSEANVKVRQPLPKIVVRIAEPQPNASALEVLKDEINVKEVEWHHGTETLTADLDFNITPELREEGEARELIRAIQKLRKLANLSFESPATVSAPSWPESWRQEIESRTNSKLTQGQTLALV
jgi:isoleucyl-tRNA synthetase